MIRKVAGIAAAGIAALTAVVVVTIRQRERAMMALASSGPDDIHARTDFASLDDNRAH